tara:strand:+ start:422 stop:3406 length:2985 start_codon:yes stop_codon:yes gene_type:complete
MQKFKYLTKQNDDSLLNKYDYEELKKKIIIQSSKYNEVILFDDICDFLKFNDNLPDNNKIYNEVIFYDDIQKFKLDIDIKDDIFEKMYEILDIDQLINDCISTIFKIINSNKFKYYIFDSSDIDLKIISKHVIFDFYLNNSHDSKILYYEMIEILSNKYNYDELLIIDNSVYKNIQNFRLPYHKKINSNRIKMNYIDKKLHIVKGMIKNYDNDEIHIIELNELNKKYIKSEINNNDNNIELEQNVIDNILNIAKKHTNSFKLRNIISNKIIFDRVSKSYCEICERRHDNENSLYIIVYDTKFRIYCRRNDTKYIEYNLKNNNSDLKLNKYLIMKHNLTNKLNINEKNDIYNKFNKKNIIKYEQNELKDYEFYGKKVLIIHSNVKTGKTKQLKKYLEKNSEIENIIIISFRILFSIELNDKFSDFTNYLNVKSKQYSLKKIKKIIIQLDSLYKLTIDIQPDILILDEIESVLNQFASPYIKNIKLIWEIFECLLKTSKKILCMDANITDRTVNLLTNLFNIDDIIYHHNTYSTIKNDNYHILFNFKNFITLLDKSLNDNKKIVIPTNSLKQAKLINQYIKKYHNTKYIKLYSSETDDYTKQKDLSDVNTNWCKYDIIIYTPCITAGVSFEIDHFDCLFGYFTNQSCDIYTLYQMLYRVRNLKEHDIYILFDILSINDNITINKKDILEEIKYSFKYLYNEAIQFKMNFNNNETTNIIDENDIFFNLWLDNKLIKNKSHHYILYEFIELLNNNNCNYEYIFNLKNYKINAVDLNQIINDIILDENTKIKNAPDITADTYITLNNNLMLTEDYKIIKKKHFLKTLFNNFDEFTMDFLNEYNRPLRINQCINLIKVKNFTIHISSIIRDLLNDNNDLINNQCIHYLTIEKHIQLKQIIEIILLTGLDVYNINNHNILFNDYIKNIEINNNKLIDIFNVLNISYNNKITEKDIKKIVNNTWDLCIRIFKLTKGKNNADYVELTRSIYFNNTFPIKAIQI